MLTWPTKEERILGADFEKITHFLIYRSETKYISAVSVDIILGPQMYLCN